MAEEAIPHQLHRGTSQLRWYRPLHGSDNDMVLQQAWQNMVTGEMEWRALPKFFED